MSLKYEPASEPLRSSVKSVSLSWYRFSTALNWMGSASTRLNARLKGEELAAGLELKAEGLKL